MVKRYEVKYILEGLMYDVNLKIQNNQVKQAYELIKHRIAYIDKINDSDSYNVVFD